MVSVFIAAMRIYSDIELALGIAQSDNDFKHCKMEMRCRLADTETENDYLIMSWTFKECYLKVSDSWR